jgi:preprotein translocase subunit Sec61beta
MSSSDGGGLMSSAGLVRYFDSEDDKGLTFDPKTVIAFSTLLGILVLMLNAFA